MKWELMPAALAVAWGSMLMLTDATAQIEVPQTPLDPSQPTFDFHDNSGDCVYKNRDCHGSGSKDDRRSDDFTPYAKVREFFFPETGIDPMRQKYEELFDEPFPPPGNEQFQPWKPFDDVKKFNDAFDLHAVAGAKTRIESTENMLRLSILLPRSEDKALKIHINQERILLSLIPKTPPGPYRIAQEQNLSIPDPPHVNASSARVNRDGNLVYITFLRQNKVTDSP